mmetsp:Transcript_733/g.1299  ORF Transcript_733/g.1299 Transcript_733/m.1299 type:complete len:661 (+) Transcript_733:61-2043(+)
MPSHAEMMEMSFSKRWEAVGVREDLEEITHPKDLKSNAVVFNRIGSSQRLKHLDGPAEGDDSGEQAAQRELNPWEVRHKPKPKKKMLRKYQRGEFVDLLMGTEKAPEVAPRGLPFDPLETVLQGMKDINSDTGPSAVVHRRRVARHWGKPTPQISLPQRSKASAAPGNQPLLEESMSPMSRARRRYNVKQRLLAILEFSAWLDQVFEDEEEFWQALTGSKDFSIDVAKDVFVKVLAERSYPMGDLGAKTLFFFLDDDEDQRISWSEVMEALQEAQDANENESASPKRWELFSTQSAEVRTWTDQDILEEHRIDSQVEKMIRRGYESATKSAAREALIRRLWKEEPLVAEFMEFFFNEFKSIQLAWRILDVKRQGLISRDDFVQSMKSLRSSRGLSAMEAHISGLFSQLDPAQTGRVRLADIIQEPRHGVSGHAALLDHFREFVKARAKIWEDQGGSFELFEDVFDPAAGGRVSKAAFASALVKLGYEEWHAEQLFNRLDRDGSGDIEMTDFTALFKEIGAGMCYKQPQPIEPVGNYQRVRYLLGDHTSLGKSARLVLLDHEMERQTVPTAPLNRSTSDSLLAMSGHLRSRIESAEVVRRPGRDMTRPSSSSRKRSGKDPQLTFAKTGGIPEMVPHMACAIDDFDDSPSRCRVGLCHAVSP